MLKGHGNDWYNYKGKLKVDFSSNVWFQGPPKALLTHISDNIASVANYPEPNAESLCKQAEEFYKLPKGSALISNGSVEAFYLIAKQFANQQSIIICPPFAEYEDACSQFNHDVNYLNNDDFALDTAFDSDLVWLCNPNNPDGKIISAEWIQTWLDKYPETVFVIDEAYADLCFGFESIIPLITKFPNLMVVKSFTKAFAIPGLRLGILLGNPSLINEVQQHLQPWSVNSLAQAAGAFILKNHKELMFDVCYMHQLSQNMQAKLQEHALLEVTSSLTNYFLVKTLKSDAQSLKDYLINEHGFLIRNASNFESLTPQHFRLAIQNKEHNNLLIKAIFQWLG